eukprot:Plantae.Rhodophyta-Hildenbrandia_rubra.ctg4479.p1 GENE.Plantae.Rhodophyta-Hildenbrandia_rubra.ctg4479~~Plantae.Rhodophyta-Hildenbrandia_rubra.ctg4479.p1  ORF type:complete len:891 (-),score=154.77 Plantae.Rhodophyta-Hildenbrandia_rubra.ctg4479:6718-9390(-)
MHSLIEGGDKSGLLRLPDDHLVKYLKPWALLEGAGKDIGNEWGKNGVVVPEWILGRVMIRVLEARAWGDKTNSVNGGESIKPAMNGTTLAGDEGQVVGNGSKCKGSSGGENYADRLWTSVIAKLQDRNNCVEDGEITADEQTWLDGVVGICDNELVANLVGNWIVSLNVKHVIESTHLNTRDKSSAKTGDAIPEQEFQLAEKDGDSFTSAGKGGDSFRNELDCLPATATPVTPPSPLRESPPPPPPIKKKKLPPMRVIPAEERRADLPLTKAATHSSATSGNLSPERPPDISPVRAISPEDQEPAIRDTQQPAMSSPSIAEERASEAVQNRSPTMPKKTIPPFGLQLRSVPFKPRPQPSTPQLDLSKVQTAGRSSSERQNRASISPNIARRKLPSSASPFKRPMASPVPARRKPRLSLDEIKKKLKASYNGKPSLIVANEPVMDLNRPSAASKLSQYREKERGRGGTMVSSRRPTPSPQRRNTFSPQHRSTMSSPRAGTVSPHRRSTMSPQGRATVSPQQRGSKSPRSSIVMSPSVAKRPRTASPGTPKEGENATTVNGRNYIEIGDAKRQKLNSPAVTSVGARTPSGDESTLCKSGNEGLPVITLSPTMSAMNTKDGQANGSIKTDTNTGNPPDSGMQLPSSDDLPAMKAEDDHDTEKRSTILENGYAPEDNAEHNTAQAQKKEPMKDENNCKREPCNFKQPSIRDVPQSPSKGNRSDETYTTRVINMGQVRKAQMNGSKTQSFGSHEPSCTSKCTITPKESGLAGHHKEEQTTATEAVSVLTIPSEGKSEVREGENFDDAKKLLGPERNKISKDNMRTVAKFLRGDRSMFCDKDSIEILVHQEEQKDPEEYPDHISVISTRNFVMNADGSWRRGRRQTPGPLRNSSSA